MNEFRGERNATVAAGASPALRHPAQQELRFGEVVAAAPWTPGIKTPMELLLRLFPEPFVELLLDDVWITCWRDDMEIGTFEMHGWQRTLGYLEAILPSEIAMRGTGDIAPGRPCGIHRRKGSLLAFDPFETLCDSIKNGLFRNGKWCRELKPAVREDADGERRSRGALQDRRSRHGIQYLSVRHRLCD